jgi:chemotaxis protein CheD
MTGGATLRTVKIGPGEHYVTRDRNDMIVTVLGSCVSACIRDPLAGVGGMNHFMLPESSTGAWGQTSANMRYGNFAMEQLINEILGHGGQRGRLEIKVFGGAAMIAGGAAIGHQNADFVEAYLRAESMPIAARHLRGLHARRIHYTALAGKVAMLEMRRDDAPVADVERRFLGSLRAQPDSGSIELFD